MTEEEAKTKWCPHARQAVVTIRELKPRRRWWPW